MMSQKANQRMDDRQIKRRDEMVFEMQESLPQGQMHCMNCHRRNVKNMVNVQETKAKQVILSDYFLFLRIIQPMPGSLFPRTHTQTHTRIRIHFILLNGIDR